MKTRLLPLIALVSASAILPVQAASNNAYVTDSYGEIVRDSSGNCVRSKNWTAETAIASCEKTDKTNAEEMTTSTKMNKKCTPPKELLPPVKGDIAADENEAYVTNSDGYIVRDNYGYCVRSINWTKEIAIPKCEGWAEPKPEPVAKPAPVVVPAPVVQPKPAHIVKDDAPDTFRGFFDFDKAILKADAKHKLDAYATYLDTHTTRDVKVTGHTDSTGSKQYNQGLSERRANAVKTYLKNKGIAAQRIETIGMGEDQPIATNKTREGRAKNRRVEMEIIK